MIPDLLGQQLHDRATRDQPLSPEEKVQLEAWYAQQDEAERHQLTITPEATNLETLQRQIQQTLEQIAKISQINPDWQYLFSRSEFVPGCLASDHSRLPDFF